MNGGCIANTCLGVWAFCIRQNIHWSIRVLYHTTFYGGKSSSDTWEKWLLFCDTPALFFFAAGNRKKGKQFLQRALFLV